MSCADAEKVEKVCPMMAMIMLSSIRIEMTMKSRISATPSEAVEPCASRMHSSTTLTSPSSAPSKSSSIAGTTSAARPIVEAHWGEACSMSSSWIRWASEAAKPRITIIMRARNLKMSCSIAIIIWMRSDIELLASPSSRSCRIHISSTASAETSLPLAPWYSTATAEPTASPAASLEPSSAPSWSTSPPSTPPPPPPRLPPPPPLKKCERTPLSSSSSSYFASRAPNVASVANATAVSTSDGRSSKLNMSTPM